MYFFVAFKIETKKNMKNFWWISQTYVSRCGKFIFSVQKLRRVSVDAECPLQMRLISYRLSPTYGDVKYKLL